MKTRLSNFESFVHQMFTDRSFPIKNNSSDNWQKLIELEKSNLLEAMYDLCFGHHDDIFVARVHKIYHLRLTAISNNIYQSIREEVWQGKSRKQLDPLFAHKMYLLLSIDQLLEAAISISSMSNELIAPKYNVDVVGKSLADTFGQISRRLKRNKVSATIISILHDYFHEMDSSRNVAFNYRDLEYAQKVSRGIQKMLKRDPGALWADRIWQLLIHLGFNRERMQQYTKQHMYEKAILDKPYNVSLIELELLRKDIKSIDVDERYAYDPGHYPLKSYILNVINEELNWIEKNILEIEKEIVRQNENYFLMDITQRQLNLLAFINLKIQRIPHHSHRHVLKVLSIFIRPIGSVPLNVKNLSKKTIGTDKATVRGLYAYLMSMVEYLKVNYGDLLN